MMVNLNRLNGADRILLQYVKELLNLKVNKTLVGVEMGIAYGGGVEEIGKIWKDRGIIYGYDTFEDGHPRHLAPDPDSFEATCMDNWYREDVHGTAALAYDYQRKELDRQGLDNVILVKGEVKEDSCKDIPYINYCFLDMDIKESMEIGYKAVRDKILPGFVLFLHDVLPPHHIPRIYHWCYDEVMGKDRNMWRVLGNWSDQFLIGLMREDSEYR